MGRKTFSPGTLIAPIPAVLVSVGDMEKSNLITIAWVGIMNTHPPKAYISVRPERHSYSILKESGEFVINLVSRELVYAADYAGIYTGAKVDKFKNLNLTKIPSEKVAAPTVKESPLSLECRVSEVIKMGTHDCFIADILSVSCNDSLLDENGKICLERAGLVAYAHGEYYALGERVGKFGHSAVKKQTSKKPSTASNAKASASSAKTSSQSTKDVSVTTPEEKKRPFYLDAPGYKKRGKRK